MSKIAELAYDIEQLYIEGYSPKTIAAMLECPITLIYDWLESESLDADEEGTEQGERVFDAMVKELA
jgi:transposase